MSQTIEMRRLGSFARVTKRFFSGSAPPAGVDKVGVFVFSSITLLGLGLGVWQLQRYGEKVEKIKNTKTKLESEILSLRGKCQTNLYIELNAVPNRRVDLGVGKFDHDNEVLLGLRTGPTGKSGQKAQGMATNPQGYFVITPFVRDSDGLVVYVNRGWVPQKMQNFPRPTGPVSLVGVTSSFEKKARFSPINDPSSKRLIWLEARALVEATNKLILSTVPQGDEDLSSLVALVELVDDTPSVPTEGLHRAADTLPLRRSLTEVHEEAVSPLTHQVYALTWFSLAAAGAVMTYYKFRKPRFPRRPKPAEPRVSSAAEKTS